ncbi:MAG: hypothetical protein P8Y79_12735 [Ignavibacteriaceae bacterium]|jgi:hypothetical protein
MKKSYLIFFLSTIIFYQTIPAQNEVSFTLINKTGFDFVDVYISPADQNQWSEDLTLGLFNNFEQKDLRIKTKSEICSYDLKAVRLDSTELVFKNLNLCKMLIVTLLYEFDEPAFVQDLILENHTDYTFMEIYVRDLPNSPWGVNVLGTNALTPREKTFISIKQGNSKSCNYEIKAVLINRKELIYKNVNICNQSHIVLLRYQGKPYSSFDW